jgi:hypothetical protein
MRNSSDLLNSSHVIDGYGMRLVDGYNLIGGECDARTVQDDIRDGVIASIARLKAAEPGMAGFVNNPVGVPRTGETQKKKKR